MKYFFGTIIIFISSISILFASNDQKPQTVYSVVKQKQSVEWYVEQSKLWKAVIDKNKADANAWLNYYTAQRMLKISHSDVTQDDLNKLIAEMEKHIPNTFEFHYISFWNSGWDLVEKNINHLRKAQELGPNRVELMDDLYTYYELNRNHEKLSEIAQAWFLSNDISSGLFAWNYNMLQSTEQGSILITSADNDTYPAWILQQAKEVRPDVIVLNQHLLGLKSYRDKYFKELGLPNYTEDPNCKNYHAKQGALIKHILQNSSRPLYFSITTPASVYQEFKDDVYNVGMAYKYSDKKFDNIAVTKRNFEKIYLLDYIKMEVSNDISQGVVNNMNSNYLVSLITLYNHYKESEDPKASEVEQLIKVIAKQNDIEEKVVKYLNGSQEIARSLVIKHPKTIEKGMVKVLDTMYVSETEVTNEMYELFLTDLLKQKRYDDINIAKSAYVNWRSYLPPNKLSLKDEEIFKHGHPDEGSFPVVNITYDAAVLYCKWLSNVYNSIDHKKKKFGYIEFRLPSEKEWEYLAKANNKNASYAWGGPYVRNAKGCFLANINASDSSHIPNSKNNNSQEVDECPISGNDGGYFPVGVSSYFPNNFGLYNMTGNVAEMTSTRGLAKGGSWHSSANDAKIEKKQNYTGASPEIGFRVIMIVK